MLHADEADNFGQRKGCSGLSSAPSSVEFPGFTVGCHLMPVSCCGIFCQGDLCHVVRSDVGFEKTQDLLQETSVLIVGPIKTMGTANEDEPSGCIGHELGGTHRGSQLLGCR